MASSSTVNWFNLDYETTPPFFLAVLNFAILIGLLIKFAGPKLRGFLKTRHQTIKHNLEESQRIYHEAKTKLASIEARITNLDQEIETIHAEAVARNQQERERIIAQANKQAASLIADAEKQIQIDLIEAKEQLKQQLLVSVIKSANQVLETNIENNDQNHLVDHFTSSLTSHNPS